MNKSLIYQPITVCIVNKHADITHSNEVSPAPFTLSSRLLSVSQQLCEELLREDSYCSALSAEMKCLVNTGTDDFN